MLTVSIRLNGRVVLDYCSVVKTRAVECWESIKATVKTWISSWELIFIPPFLPCVCTPPHPCKQQPWLRFGLGCDGSSSMGCRRKRESRLAFAGNPSRGRKACRRSIQGSYKVLEERRSAVPVASLPRSLCKSQCPVGLTEGAEALRCGVVARGTAERARCRGVPVARAGATAVFRILQFLAVVGE